MNLKTNREAENAKFEVAAVAMNDIIDGIYENVHRMNEAGQVL
jgi:hypothetical protein